MVQRKLVLSVLIVSMVALAGGLGLWQAGVAQARPPAQQPTETGTTIPYPGNLTDKTGQAVVDGFYDFNFVLYDLQQGGAQLWAETQEGVTVSGGAFLVSLGSVNPIPTALLEGGERWLEIAVRGPAEAGLTTLSPRQRLEVASPSAAISQAGGPCPHDHWGESWSGDGTGLTLTSSDSIAIEGSSTSASGGIGVAGTSTNGAGISGYSTNGSGVSALSWNHIAVNALGQTGVYASGTYTGVYGIVSLSTNAVGVTGIADNNDCTNGMNGCSGVLGSSDRGRGVAGYTETGNGVYAYSNAGTALFITSGSGNLIEAHDFYPADRKFYVNNAGDVYADGTYSSPAADLAEMLPAVDGLEPGDVLAIGLDGKLARSSQPYQASIVGVYSTEPAFLAGSGDDVDPAGKVPLAVIGIVPVKVSAENGPIHPGDLLVASSIPGHAMKAGPNPAVGTVLGKALEGLAGGSGVIQILLTLQ